MALAPTVMAHVELFVQVSPQDCPHEPLQMFWLLQNREQFAEPPQLFWETSQDSPLTQMQLASTQFSGLPLQPAQSTSGRQHRISARMSAPWARSELRTGQSVVDRLPSAGRVSGRFHAGSPLAFSSAPPGLFEVQLPDMFHQELARGDRTAAPPEPSSARSGGASARRSGDDGALARAGRGGSGRRAVPGFRPSLLRPQVDVAARE